MTRRRCFISAAYGANVAVLQRVLDQYDIAWEWASTVLAQKPLLDSIVDAIKRCDFVVGVLPENAPNANVLLELGIAIGQGLPILVFSTGKNLTIFDLSTFSHFDTELQNEKLLSFQLDLFLKGLATKEVSKQSPASRSTGASLRVKDQPARGIFGSAFEQSVATVIRRAGGRVTVPTGPRRDALPDLLMWLPEQDKELFNPAAIEAKEGIGLDHLPDLQMRLAEFVRVSSMGCGLIVVNSATLQRRHARLAPIPGTFVISLLEFRSKIEAAELGAWIRHQRNRLVHGVR